MNDREGWTGRKCPHCKGTGVNLRIDHPRACPECGGTGDEWGILDRKGKDNDNSKPRSQ